MLFLFLGFFGAINTYVDITTLYVEGDGTFTNLDLTTSGGYKSYTTIFFKKGPTKIDQNAITDCESLETVHLSSTITSIIVPFLRYCGKLTKITIETSDYFYADSSGALYSKNMTELYRVPITISSYEINSQTEILKVQCFQLCSLRTIIIPTNVIEIQELAFCDSKITSVQIDSQKIQTLGEQSFSWMTSLQSINIPSSVLTLGIRQFYRDVSLSSVKFAEKSNITVIPQGCFEDTGITSITFPEGIETIETEAMTNCKKLTQIHLPKSLSAVSQTWLSYSDAVTEVTINPGGKYQLVDGVLKDTGETEILYISKEKKDLKIPSTVTTIAAGALQFASQLINVTYAGDAMKFIDGILYDSSNVAIAVAGGKDEATFIENCPSVYDFCAMCCRSLQTVTLSSTISSVGTGSFLGCTSLLQIRFPPIFSSVGGRAFEGCTSLHTVDIDDSETQISFNGSCFQDCSSLRNIDIGKRVKHVYYYSFSNTDIVAVNFVETSILTFVDVRAFLSCKSLEEVTICSKITEVYEYAFYDCGNLAKLTIVGSGLTRVGNSAFMFCGLTSLSLPASINQIDAYAFKNCPLNTISIDPTSPITWLTSGIFEGCKLIAHFSIPGNINSIDPSIFVDCELLETITSSSPSFTVDRNLLYKTNSELVLCPPGKIDADIKSGVTEIGPNAFYKCKKLKTVTFEEVSLLSRISGSTFMECTSLLSLKIPASVVQIDSNAFASCISLSEVEFGNGSNLEKLGDSTFQDCTSLKKCIFKETSRLLSIGSSAFAGCTKLTSFYIPSSVTMTGSSVFRGCTGLTSVEFGPNSSIGTLSSQMFSKCENLTTVTLPPLIHEIGESAFQGCKKLRMEIPTSVTRIKDLAFFECSSLKLAKIPEGVVEIGSASFQQSLTETTIRLPDGIGSVGSGAFTSTQLNIVIYCGESVLTGTNVFNPTTVGYVKANYSNAKLLGMQAIHCMTNGCVLITPTPSGSHFFTAYHLIKADRFVIAQVLMSDDVE